MIYARHCLPNALNTCPDDTCFFRPTVAGIHPGPEGAYSIALSGGYEDDVDIGECFTYTGEGGRDLTGTANKPKVLTLKEPKKAKIQYESTLTFLIQY